MELESQLNEDEPTKLWEPGLFGMTNIDKFRELINGKYELNLKDYWDLHQWSITKYDVFWEEFWHFSGLRYFKIYDTVVDKSKSIDDIPSWFDGSLLNYAENILKHAETIGDRVALYVTSEADQGYSSVTFKQLNEKVCLIAEALKQYDVGMNDVVAGYVPNNEIALEALLASSTLGCIWTSTSPEIGVKTALERFKQVEPKVLFSVDSVYYNGKRHDNASKLCQLASKLPTLKLLVLSSLVCNTSDDQIQELKTKMDELGIVCVTESELCKKSGKADKIDFKQVPFSHPLYVLYSSGTTGPPKGMVHSVGGSLIQHLKEHMLHSNMGSQDILLYYTTTGWMMWNWMISALALGSAVVLYDGSPLAPVETILWDLIDKIGVTVFGTSAKYLATIEKRNMKPRETHSLNTLHTILSTASPLTPASYRYVYRDVKKDLLLGSISGGSDIVSCFMGQNPTVPVHEGEIQSPNLGMAIACFSEDGQPVFDAKGELVCTKPFPCMPVKFLDDADFAKYRKAYFSKFKGVWHHGDYCIINKKTKGIVMLGRSDATLNPQGVRFGSSEIYSVIETFPQVLDSVCVSQAKPDGDERVVLFVVLRNENEFNESLCQSIRNAIRSELSARHVPSIILPVKDIPYTISGKKVEIAVKSTINGNEPPNVSALANPESLEGFKNIPELRIF